MPLFATSCLSLGHLSPVASCLHLQLRPYTLGHELLLWATRNPIPHLAPADFDALPEPQRHAALVAACDICNQTWLEYHANAEILRRPVPWTRLLGRGARLRRLWARWRRKLAHLTPADWESHLLAFRGYLAAGRAALPTLSNDPRTLDPAIWRLCYPDDPAPTGGRPLGAPLLAQLLNFALARLTPLLHRSTTASVLDLPFSAVLNLFLAEMESQGRIHIENDLERQQRADILAAEAAKPQPPTS